jgi:hypothetical protein
MAKTTGADPYELLDAAPLLKHFLAAENKRAVTLAYLYWEPSGAAAHEPFAVHRRQAEQLASALIDDQVRMVALSYPQLWARVAGAERTASRRPRRQIARPLGRYARGLMGTVHRDLEPGRWAPSPLAAELNPARAQSRRIRARALREAEEGALTVEETPEGIAAPVDEVLSRIERRYGAGRVLACVRPVPRPACDDRR